MATGSPIERMPLELNTAILSFLPDFKSLISAALSCKTLFAALKTYESQIVFAVLQLHPSVLPEAYAAWQFSQVSDTPDRDEIIGFMKSFFSVRKVPEQVWTVKKALPLERLRTYAQYFAQKIPSDLLRDIKRTPLEPDQYQLSQPCLRRFERSLYRFEIYCNLFSHSALDGAERKDVFFSRFAPWENEQFRCIYAHLQLMVVPCKF